MNNEELAKEIFRSEDVSLVGINTTISGNDGYNLKAVGYVPLKKIFADYCYPNGILFTSKELHNLILGKQFVLRNFIGGDFQFKDLEPSEKSLEFDCLDDYVKKM